MLNSFASTLPINIFQLAVNIILGGIYKMQDVHIVVAFSLVMLVCVGVLSYILGYREGYSDSEVHAKLVAIREQSLLLPTQKHVEVFKKLWK